jgi:hypothetical protein
MMRRSPFGNTKPKPRRPAKQWTATELPGPRVPLPRAVVIAHLVRPIPKDSPTRDEAYRRLVAALPCSNCGIEGYSQAAHGPTLGGAIKSNDTECFPLCCDRPEVKGCHPRFDQYELFDAPTRVLKAIEWAARAREQIEWQPA